MSMELAVAARQVQNGIEMSVALQQWFKGDGIDMVNVLAVFDRDWNRSSSTQDAKSKK